MFKRLIIIKDNMINIIDYDLDMFDVIKMFYQNEVSDDWEYYYNKGYHLLLEECDRENDFEWCLEVLDETVEEFFIWHARKVAYPMDNWWKWFDNKYLKRKWYLEGEDLSQVYNPECDEDPDDPIISSPVNS